MAPLFRSFRTPATEDAGGSGGKLLRKWRREPSASPYARPKSSLPSTPAPSPPLLLPAPAPPTGSRFLGLISGAGKLISSVFRSDESSSPSTSSSASGYSSEEEDIGHCSDEKEDNDVSNQIQHLYQGEKTPELLNYEERSKAIILMSESKLVIEQLLMQETFTRDEFIRLTKLMQSRVLSSPASEMGQKRAENEMLRNDDSAIAPSTGWEPLSQRRELAETFPCCHSNLNALSPSFHSPLACTPGADSAAVMEARKWLDERKLASNSNSNIVCGPCVLNTDMLNSDLFDEVGSPVNLAKSYMRSLPPWQSPSLGRNYLNTPPSRKTNLFKDGNTNESGSNSLPSFKVFKRKYLSSISMDSPVETRRVRMRSTENVPESPKLKGTDSDMFGKETLKASSSNDQILGKVLGTYHDSSVAKAAKTSNASENLNLECVEDQHSIETFKLSNEKIVSASPPTTDKDNSTRLASEPAAIAVELSCQTVLPVVESLEPTHAKIETAAKLDVEKLDAIEPSNSEQCCTVINGCHESVGFDSCSVKHGKPLHKTEAETADGSNFIKQSSAADVQASNIHTVGEVAGTLEAKDTAELSLNSGINPRADDPLLKDEANGTVNKPSTNGSSAESNTNSQLESDDKDKPGYSGNGETTGGLGDEPNEVLAEAIGDKPVHETDTTRGKSENGTKMKSIERVLTAEPPSGATRYGRKAVVRMKRGRGRGGKTTGR